MKSQLALLLLSAVFSVSAFAAAPKSYQVTGPVVDVSDTTITVEKKKGENWEITKSATTKTTGGDVKKGDKVTVYYTMSADEIEVKADKKKK